MEEAQPHCCTTVSDLTLLLRARFKGGIIRMEDGSRKSSSARRFTPPVCPRDPRRGPARGEMIFVLGDAGGQGRWGGGDKGVGFSAKIWLHVM